MPAFCFLSRPCRRTFLPFSRQLHSSIARPLFSGASCPTRPSSQADPQKLLKTYTQSTMSCPSLTTELTKKLGCRVPIVSAAMAGAASVELASQVSLAGGFGFIGEMLYSPQQSKASILAALDEQLRAARNNFSNIPNDHLLPVGYGILCWKLEKFDQDSDFAESYLGKVVDHVQCIWLSFGRKLIEWIKLVDTLRERSSKSHPQPCQITVLVSAVKEVQDMIDSGILNKVDVLIVQGSESGGHGASDGLPINAFIPLVAQMLSSSNIPPAQLPVLVAAGGLVNGNHLASMLALGVSGVVCGTRFLTTPEAKYSTSQKQALIQAKANDTIRTTIFDTLRNTTGWPPGTDGRALINETVVDHLGGVTLDSLQQHYNEAVKVGDVKRIVTWCGASIGCVNRIQPAQEVVREIAEEALVAIKRISNQVG